jgi:hypothetical protein
MFLSARTFTSNTGAEVQLGNPHEEPEAGVRMTVSECGAVMVNGVEENVVALETEFVPKPSSTQPVTLNPATPTSPVNETVAAESYQ